MPDVSYSVLVKEEHRDNLEQIAKSLEAKGMKVEKTIPRMRYIRGTAQVEDEEGLRSIEGVETLRREHTYQLPPMDEKTPQ